MVAVDYVRMVVMVINYCSMAHCRHYRRQRNMAVKYSFNFISPRICCNVKIAFPYKKDSHYKNKTVVRNNFWTTAQYHFKSIWSYLMDFKVTNTIYSYMPTLKHHGVWNVVYDLFGGLIQAIKQNSLWNIYWWPSFWSISAKDTAIANELWQCQFEK